MQPSSRPRVRSACEGCHERKQRCVIPENGGSCMACQQASRYCFFIPRSKAGRPRRLKSSDDAATLSQHRRADSSTHAEVYKQPENEPSTSSSSVADTAYGGHGEPTSGFEDTLLDFSTDFYSPLPQLEVTTEPGPENMLSVPPYSSGILDSINDGSRKSPFAPDSILLDKLTELSHYRQEMCNGSFDGLMALQLVVTSLSTLSAAGSAVSQGAAQAAGKPDLALLALAYGAMLRGVDVAIEVLGAAEMQISGGMTTCTSPTMSATLHGGNWTVSSSSSNSSQDGSSRCSKNLSTFDLNAVLILQQLDVALTQAQICLSQLRGFREVFASATPRAFSNVHGRVSGLIRTIYGGSHD